MKHRTAKVSIYNDKGSEVTISYPAPPEAVNETIREILFTGVDEYFRIHGPEDTALTVYAELYDDESVAADEDAALGEPPLYKIVVRGDGERSLAYPYLYTFAKAKAILADVINGDSHYEIVEAT